VLVILVQFFFVYKFTDSNNQKFTKYFCEVTSSPKKMKRQNTLFSHRNHHFRKFSLSTKCHSGEGFSPHFFSFCLIPPILELSLPLYRWIFSFSPSPVNTHLALVRYKSTLFSLVVCGSVCFVNDGVSLAVPCSVGDGGAGKTYKNFCLSCGEG